jgi:hypothetical protein
MVEHVVVVRRMIAVEGVVSDDPEKGVEERSWLASSAT